MPKTGTHSVRQALREQLGEGDIEQVGLFVNKRFPWEGLAAIQHGHLSLRQVRPYLGEDAFEHGYPQVFAFVRNPFDRFGLIRLRLPFMLRGGDVFPAQRLRGRRCATSVFEEPPEHHRSRIFQPASFAAGGRGWQDPADRCRSAASCRSTCRGSYDADLRPHRHCLPASSIGSTAATRGDYRRYYDRDLIDGVAARYAQDLELFGYDFEGMR